jgi:chromate transporter
MIYASLYFEFFKIGLFAIGGGMATIPFLRHLAESSGWFSIAFIADMVAISESTPGPIGINMATYAGFNVAGVLGGVVATLGMVTPSIIIVSLVAGYLDRYRRNHLVEHMFLGLRPAVTALIAVAGFEIVSLSVFRFSLFESTRRLLDLVDWPKAALFVVMFVLIRRYKKHPLVYIAASAVIGIAFGYLG